MADRAKKTRISVNKDELDAITLEEFDFVAKAYQIPRGKLLSRALYLAAREIRGEAVNYDINVGQDMAKRAGRTVDKDILLDTKSWLKLVS